MSDKIVSLFGNTIEGEVLDKEVTADNIFEKVKEHNFTKVLVIGIDEDSQLGFSTNLENAAQVTFLIEKFKLALLSEDFG